MGKGDNVIDDLERHLSQRIEQIEDKLTQRIDNVEDKLTQRIDSVEKHLSQGIESSVTELKAEMSANMSTVLDQLALRTASDRLIKAGFGVAVLGVLIQTVLVALK